MVDQNQPRIILFQDICDQVSVDELEICFLPHVQGMVLMYN